MRCWEWKRKILSTPKEILLCKQRTFRKYNRFLNFIYRNLEELIVVERRECVPGILSRHIYRKGTKRIGWNDSVWSGWGEGEGEVSQVSQDPNLNFDQSEVKFIRGWDSKSIENGQMYFPQEKQVNSLVLNFCFSAIDLCVINSRSSNEIILLYECCYHAVLCRSSRF